MSIRKQWMGQEMGKTFVEMSITKCMGSVVYFLMKSNDSSFPISFLFKSSTIKFVSDNSRNNFCKFENLVFRSCNILTFELMIKSKCRFHIMIAMFYTVSSDDFQKLKQQ